MKFAREQLMELLNVDESKISTPPDDSMGDYSTTIAFEKAEENDENPALTAVKIIKDLDLEDTVFRTVRAYGPYINFFLDKEEVMYKILRKVLQREHRYASHKRRGEIVVVEFPSPNTNKPLHLGHLRNMSLGECTSRVLDDQGYNVKRVNLYNDRGVHICKSMLAYQRWGRGRTPDDFEGKPDHFVGHYYVMYSRNEDESLEEAVQEMLQDWEDGDEEVRSLWKKMNKWAYEGYEETFNQFGLPEFDDVYYESEIYKQGKEIVEEGLDKGVFEEDEDGGVFIDLGDLGKKYVMREDGTSLYATQDLALAKRKYKDYKFKKSVYVVASEQDYYFKQLFKIFRELGYEFADKCEHLSYGMVLLPEGSMKSREGKVVDADELMDEMKELAEEEVEDRANEVSEEVCEQIGLAGIKYYLLKTNRGKDLVFDPEESISFDGKTGPYLLYSLVRARRILNKAEMRLTNYIHSEMYNTSEEYELIKSYSKFPQVIKRTKQDLSPHHLANYAYEVAKRFNSFYEKCPVMQVEDKKLRKARLLLVKGYNFLMTKCLKLMGIKPVEEM